MNPHTHARASVKRYGGQLEDYLDIHEYLDSSKHAVADMRHRMLTHTPFFAENVIPRVFGSVRTNSAGKLYSPKQVTYDHIGEDFKGQVPATADWFLSLDMEGWMLNGRERCPSAKRLGASAALKKKREEHQAYGG